MRKAAVCLLVLPADWYENRDKWQMSQHRPEKKKAHHSEEVRTFFPSRGKILL
jgi:hypothetical protein